MAPRILACIFALGLYAGDKAPVLVHEYKVDDPALMDMSGDGRFILTRSRRIESCGNPPVRCLTEVLGEYDTHTGKATGEHSFADRTTLNLAAFLPDNRVSAVSTSWDPLTKTTNRSRLLWEPLSNLRTVTPYPPGTPALPVGQLDSERFLQMTSEPANPLRARLQVVGPNGTQDLRHPAISTGNARSLYRYLPSLFPQTFRSWRSAKSVLVESDDPTSILYWISTDPDEPPRICHSFPGERIHGYAVAPDTSVVAVVTGRGELPVGSAGYRVVLTVLDGETCEVIRRSPLLFPEKPGSTAPLLAPEKKRPNNVPFYVPVRRASRDFPR